MDKWLASGKTKEEIKALIDAKIEICKRWSENEFAEPSIFDDDYLQKMYPHRNLIRTEYGVYVDAEGEEEMYEG